MTESKQPSGIRSVATKFVIAGALLAAPLTFVATPAMAADAGPAGAVDRDDHHGDRPFDHPFDGGRPWEHFRDFIPVPEFILPPTGSF